jgi:hypothetical protein
MSDKAAQRLLEGRAWDDFCEQIRRAGHMVNRFGDTANALDRTEWYRFMTRLMRNGFERFMENCEPDRPRLREIGRGTAHGRRGRNGSRHLGYQVQRRAAPPMSGNPRMASGRRGTACNPMGGDRCRRISIAPW